MSSAVVSTSAALSRFFSFDSELVRSEGRHAEHSRSSGEAKDLAWIAGTIRNQQSTISPAIGNRKPVIANLVTPASRLGIRPTPEMVSSGIAAIDALAGGLPRSCLTEICGPASSGRTTVLLSALAAATRRGEFCALIDSADALDPHSAAAAGIVLDRLLWVRCGEESPQKASSPRRHRGTEKPSETEKSGVGTQHLGVIPKPRVFTSEAGCPISRVSFAREVGKFPKTPESNRVRLATHCLELALRAADLLLDSGGFGLVALDLADLPLQTARRIPLTTWFRFRRTVEHTPTVLLSIEQQPIAGSCSSLLVQLSAASSLSVLSSQLPVLSSQSSTLQRGLDDNRLKVSPTRENGLFEDDHPEISAAQRHKNVAHGVSRGSEEQNDSAPGGRKRPTHAHLFTGLNITAELIRSRFDRKPVRSASTAFTSKTSWG